VNLKLLSYNIPTAAQAVKTPLAAVIRAAEPDLVVLQEADSADVVERLARDTDMVKLGVPHARRRSDYLSRLPVSHHRVASARPGRSVRSSNRSQRCASAGLRCPSQRIHGNWHERLRMQELTGTLASIARHQSGFHVVSATSTRWRPANSSS
jgi:endonuclease/exonuclease/phosphatase family metal-dependent hydrolase